MQEKFEIEKKVRERLAYLMRQREIIAKEYEKMDEGDLLVCPGSTKQSFRYYLRKNPQDKRGSYLNKTKAKEKAYFARKKYYKALLKNIDKELLALKSITKHQLSDSIIETYQALNPGVKRLIKPINVDDEEYIKKWKKQTYEGLGFDKKDTTAFYSELGERMRSKSEVLIANALTKSNLPYKYESPVAIKNGTSLYPDFTILDIKRRRTVYWEHLGKMGDVSYVMRNIWKLDEYKKIDIRLGINLFITYESSINALGTDDINRTIESILGE